LRATVTQRLDELRQHRALLVERAELQRNELGRALADFERPLHWVQWGLVAAEWLRSRPALAGASAAGVLVAVRKLRHWISQALLVWRLVQVIRGHLPERHEAQMNRTAPI